MSFRPIYKLRDSVKNFERYLSFISANPLAVNFVEKNLNYFIWTIFLYGNPNAVHLIEDRFKKLDPSAIDNIDLTYWDELSGNVNAFHIMKKHIDKINWDEISKYTSDIDKKKINNTCIISCYHIFHKNCILDWYKNNKSCPLCRKKLNKIK